MSKAAKTLADLEARKAKLVEDMALIEKAIKKAKRDEQEERRKQIYDQLEKSGALQASPEQLAAMLAVLNQPVKQNDDANEAKGNAHS